MVDVKATYEYTKDLSVLYVEDNESVRDASVSIFGEFFALVDSAIDGEDGINKYKEKLEAEGKSYDLVITDLNMPKVSGAELIELIHEINFEQSIVVVSAYNESHRLIELIDAGISHFIQKPIKPNQFINVAYKVAKNIVARSMLATQHQLTKNLNEDLESIVQKRTKELHLKNEELNYQLFYDTLTTLPNRNSLCQYLNEHTQASVVLININNFKHINDIYGIPNGDILIKDFSQFLKDTINPEHSTLYKLSGDEFVILCHSNAPKYTAANKIQKIAEKIQQHVFKIAYKNEVISTELGITMGYICEEENPLEKASLALSHAKKRRKLFVQYSENLNLIEAGEQDFNTIKLIKDAIKDGEVIPHFQLIQNKNGQKKYETLMRIEHNGQVILPSQFLDVAKKSGDYEQLTRIMVDKSFKYFANRKEEFSVNLSYDDISDQEMLLYLHEKIEEYGVAKRVIFEIVESENIEDFTIVKEFISDMQKLGVKIAIDDFGSGYTNYSYLLQLKPDFLKIDGSIIKNIDTCEDSYIITQSIVDFANKLGIETVAEYIHSEEIYKLTKELNIDNFQGFFLNKPSSKV